MSGSISFKKRTKPSLRQREAESDADGTSEAAASGAGEESPITLATKLKKRMKPKSRLSFGGDEEEGNGEVFQLKKSNLSRKLALSKQSSSNSNVLTSSFDVPTALPASTGPSYSTAYLNELKASTPSSRPRVAEDESILYDADVSLDTSIYTPPIVDLTTNGDLEIAIPSGGSINAAKEKRERLRTMTANGIEDYISLSLTKRDDYSGGPHPDSRLVREEDEFGEGDDEFAEYTSAQERIALGKKSRKVEARKRRENMNELIADAEEDDEETTEWEQEQLRRGGLRTESPAANAPQPVYRPVPIPTPTAIPTLGVTVTSLSRTLAMITTSHTQHTTSMVSIGDERTQLDSKEKQLREMITSAEDKRSWFAAFREWIESVATFLDEKYPMLEKLEDQQISLIKERREMIARRKNADDEDNLSLFLGSLPVHPRPQSEEIDELGRVLPQANPAIGRRDRLTARNARRQRHASASAAQNQDEDGFFTDSSLPPSDAADYAIAIQNVLDQKDRIIADVKAKDFLDPKVGLGKWFGEWREQFGETYTGAWGGLGMVAAWEFWARLEILGWDPLKEKRTLDTFDWYAALHNYSRPRQQKDEELESELGPDGDLVSSMITTAVLPRVCKILEGGSFDPYSGKHVRRLVDLAEEIEISISKEDPKFELIIKSVFLVFQSALKTTEGILPNYLTLNQPQFNPDAIPARRRYLMRQFKLLHNLLRWRKYAGDKYGLGLLAASLVNDCMFPVAEGGWEVGGEDVMRKVITVLPTELVPVPVKLRMTLK